MRLISSHVYFSIHSMMQSNSIIDKLFGGPGRIAVLRVLVAAGEPLTGRQIANLAGLSPAGAARALDRLAELGATSRRSVGRAVLHELDRSSPLVSEIILPAVEGEGRIAVARADQRAGCPTRGLSCLVEADPVQMPFRFVRARRDSMKTAISSAEVFCLKSRDKHATRCHVGRPRPPAVPVDVIPTDAREIAARGGVPGTALHEALAEGEIVYERVA
jgi:hypothetical protein